MGRPRKTAKKAEPLEKFQCLGKCKKEKTLRDNYYSTENPLYPSGKFPVCKACLTERLPKDKEPNDPRYIEMAKSVLQDLNKPYILFLYQRSIEESGKTGKDFFGTYMKNLGMNQYKNLTWADSDFEGKSENINSNEINIATSKKNEFVVTDEIIDKWGDGYAPEEYINFEKKWNKLIDNYGEKTSLHIEGLKTYIRFRVKEEMATAKGLVKDAKDWAALARDAATAAKINVSQLSKSDISGGVDLLPQLFEAIESEVGIISTLPRLKEQPYDDADIIIWCVVNYMRRLDDKSRIQYKDIWNFYDEMLYEHFKQKGYTNEMILKEKEKRNNVFRDLGEVYKEPIYEDGDS